MREGMTGRRRRPGRLEPHREPAHAALTQKVGETTGLAVPIAVSPQAEALRAELRKGMNGSPAAR